MQSPWRSLSFALILIAQSVAADPFARLDAAVADASNPSTQTAALVARGEALRRAGRAGAAIEDLRHAAEIAPSAAEQAYASGALGVALAEAGRDAAAEDALRLALTAVDQPALRAVAAATLAQVLAELERVETSSMRDARFAEAAALIQVAEAEALGPAVASAITAAIARAELASGDGAGARKRIAAISTEGTNDEARLALGGAALAAGAPDLAARFFDGFSASDPRMRAQAALGSAEAALAEGRIEDALKASDAAAMAALRLGAEDLHFTADWLRAEALKRRGDAAAAEAAYALAFEGLRDFRARSPLGAPPVPSGRGFSKERFQLDYVDFLLGSSREPAALRRARDLAEDLKLDEVDDYFAERCTPARGAARAAERLGAGALVIYPIVLDDRTEIIWSQGEEIGGYPVALSRETLRQRIAKLRTLIDLRFGGVEAEGGALFDELLGPIRGQVASAETLVVAPDGPLRALPFAALWTGDAWLGAEVGLATVLGLTLLDRGDDPSSARRALAAGAEVTDPLYAPLPSVPIELAALNRLFPGGALAEDAFTSSALAAEISRAPYDIVHIASHAEFGATPEENFILTADGSLDMTELEAVMRARAVQTDRPVSLLTLSACDTAAGTVGAAAERAPLGLAGVGFRAGAEAVLASLWPAEDVSTALLMTRFYEALADGAGRAEALRRAQAALIADPDTADPFQWANFMLIGDWR